MFDHNTLPVLFDLRFPLDAPNLRRAVLCLTLNFFENQCRGFIAILFLVDTDGLVSIGLFLVHPSGVETIAAPIIALYCCLSLYLPAVLYNFLKFPSHVCSYKALLLNDWSTPMETMCFYSF